MKKKLEELYKRLDELDDVELSDLVRLYFHSLGKHLAIIYSHRKSRLKELGFVREEKVPEGGIVTYSIRLTQRGLESLKLLPIDELVRYLTSRGCYSTMHRWVYLLGAESLPQYLTHSNPSVRNVATRRLQELSNEP